MERAPRVGTSVTPGGDQEDGESQGPGKAPHLPFLEDEWARGGGAQEGSRGIT